MVAQAAGIGAAVLVDASGTCWAVCCVVEWDAGSPWYVQLGLAFFLRGVACALTVCQKHGKHTLLGGSYTSRLHSWPPWLEMSHRSKPSLPSFPAIRRTTSICTASSDNFTVQTAVKQFEAVVHWAKVRGSSLVVCCLPALSSAGSWLVYHSVSAVDSVEGLGLRSSWNSVNWFAQLSFFPLIGTCEACCCCLKACCCLKNLCSHPTGQVVLIWQASQWHVSCWPSLHIQHWLDCWPWRSGWW